MKLIRLKPCLVVVAMLWGIVIGAQVLAADLVVVHSTITEGATANYPTYRNDFDALTDWMESHFDFDVIADTEVVHGALDGYSLAILPNNGVMSSAEVDAIRNFTESGGKVLAFYSTSLRDPNLSLVGYQIGDTFGLSWSRFVTDPEFDVIRIVSDHPALANAPREIPIASRATQEVDVMSGEIVGARATADGVVSANAVIVATENGMLITNHMASGPNLAFDEVQQLLYSIIAHYAPGSVR